SGPFFDSWPTAAHRALLGVQCEDVLQTGTFPSRLWLRDCVARFASAAYRRPASDDEVAGILAVIEKRRAAGRNELQAFGDGLKVVLCSPNFLFLPEASASEEYVRASKMAYFLWSSQPDKPLLDLASSGQLASEDVRRQQAERMLADKRSDAFVQSFLDAWLGLRELGATPPERTRFPNYYHYDLGNAMRQETLLFTKHLLDENLSVDRFLDADFTFVNRPLAKHYGIEPPQGSSFSKVELKDMRRGGLLGQASILTLTANGIDTSPVVRGVWLLENLLGTPPAPPPPDVEPLDPDTRGATTIRDQLEKHRQVASCNDCHRKIDPLGFALENFDPIGAWRDRYPGKQPIDASGALSGDREFHDVVQFKKFLMEDKRVFYQGLVRKLLAYASGKQIGPLQRPEIDRIAERLNAKDFGLRDLVIEIAISVTK
ncbi:MAG: DUF1592 domain-containing protein, partial [Planctomycetales bacterium]|nr:DUF1592 domain-containing protein [Planctomycetales bacterium]